MFHWHTNGIMFHYHNDFVVDIIVNLVDLVCWRIFQYILEIKVQTILAKMNYNKHYSLQGRPLFSASMIRYSLLLRYTSVQSYKLLLEQLPLPSFSLLRKIRSGGLDATKAVKLMLNMELVSSDCVFLVDEMYLQQGTQYDGGSYVGEDEEGNLYKGIVVFMIIGLQNSVPYVVKSI